MKSRNIVRRPGLKLYITLFFAFMIAPLGCFAAVDDYDVVIVGGTPSGIAASIAAARNGRSALLLERTTHIGGLMANGLGATDIGTRGATLGIFGDYIKRVREYYTKTYGPGSPQVEDCSDGYHFEPSISAKILAEMLAGHPSITVRVMRQFDALPENVTLENGRVTAIRILNRETGATEEVRGKVFIDATYEGDLAAAAGAPYRVGREGRSEYNEPMAGRIYRAWRAEKLAPGSSGLGDNAVQAYNYRLPLTRVSENRVPIERPADYNRDEYVSLIEDFRLNREAAVTPPHPDRARTLVRVVNVTMMPNGKIDGNNHHCSFISTDLPEENWPWPTSDWAWRDTFAKRLRDYTLGFLWFCQNDAELPADFRAECSAWGLARDEFTDNGNFPRQVYVREGRRVMGEYLFTSHDATPVAPGKRPPLHLDSVTASHYWLDSHAVRKREPGRPHLDGFFSEESAPYTVPYRIIVPKNVDDLLVPVAASATHIGLSTLRMEPCWMALGEAAGAAAAQSIADGKPLRKIDTLKLQHELLRRGVVLIYYRDFAPGDAGYEAAQLLGLHGAISGWTVNPGELIDAKTAASWRKALGLKSSALGKKKATRGEYLAQLWSEYLAAKK